MFTHTKNETRIQNVSLTTIFSCWFNVRLFYGFHLQNVCSLLAGSFWWHESPSVWDRSLTQTGNSMNSWLLVNRKITCDVNDRNSSLFLLFRGRILPFTLFIERMVRGIFWKFTRGRKGNNEVVIIVGTVEFQKDWIDPLKLIPEGIAPWRIFSCISFIVWCVANWKKRITSSFLEGQIISRIQRSIKHLRAIQVSYYIRYLFTLISQTFLNVQTYNYSISKTLLQYLIFSLLILQTFLSVHNHFLNCFKFFYQRFYSSI